MKKLNLVAAAAALLVSVSLFGGEYEKMSTDELLNLRGTPKTQQERNELHKELQNRYQTMTQEQKERFDAKPGKGQGMKQGMGQGQGMGKGMGQGQGMGMGQGKGQ